MIEEKIKTKRISDPKLVQKYQDFKKTKYNKRLFSKKHSSVKESDNKEKAIKTKKFTDSISKKEKTIVKDSVEWRKSEKGKEFQKSICEKFIAKKNEYLKSSLFKMSSLNKSRSSTAEIEFYLVVDDINNRLTKLIKAKQTQKKIEALFAIKAFELKKKKMKYGQIYLQSFLKLNRLNHFNQVFQAIKKSNQINQKRTKALESLIMFKEKIEEKEKRKTMIRIKTVQKFRSLLMEKSNLRVFNSRKAFVNLLREVDSQPNMMYSLIRNKPKLKKFILLLKIVKDVFEKKDKHNAFFFKRLLGLRQVNNRKNLYEKEVSAQDEYNLFKFLSIKRAYSKNNLSYQSPEMDTKNGYHKVTNIKLSLNMILRIVKQKRSSNLLKAFKMIQRKRLDNKVLKTVYGKVFDLKNPSILLRKSKSSKVLRSFFIPDKKHIALDDRRTKQKRSKKKSKIVINYDDGKINRNKEKKQ